MSSRSNPDPTPNAAPVFDLAVLDSAALSDAGTEIELLHPITKDPLGIFWGVLGKHSQVFRELMKERVNARIKSEQQARKRGKDADIKTAEQVEAEALNLLVACSTGWRVETYAKEPDGSIKLDDAGERVVTSKVDTIRLDGEDLTFNVPNAKRILERMIWAREQVDEGIGDLENFIKG